MPRPALSATRAADILNFLAAHPTESFTLSDLASRLHVNMASMHNVLAVLTDVGYLVRHPRHLTYALGPGVIAVGTAALEQHPAIDRARDEIRNLSEALDVELTVTARAGGDIVFLARAGRHQAASPVLHVGERAPLVPPFGSVFLAWSDTHEVDAWLARAPQAITDERRQQLRELLGVVRRRLFAVSLHVPAIDRVGAALDELATHHGAEHEATLQTALSELVAGEYEVYEIEPARSYDGAQLSAPVFSPAGEVLVAITMTGLPHGVTGDEMIRYAHRLRDAALVVTKETHGKAPAPG